ncbi:hypothetical protein A2W48_03100 [Candidatus Giovannonibacteria bacterium RIFCSPHIGHO2_12_44_12]|nr:MAG: hypothetical protein A2W48_03100 [Candidatus Giovannonibacteria bacterium RIFCSPHIGHO2_12_44_12]
MSDFGGFKVGGQWRFREKTLQERFEHNEGDNEIRSNVSKRSKIKPNRITILRQPEPLPDEILTPSEVASLLKMHLKTVYKMAENKTIPGTKLGRSWRFSRQAILDRIVVDNGKPEKAES